MRMWKHTYRQETKLYERVNRFVIVGKMQRENGHSGGKYKYLDMRKKCVGGSW